MIVLPSLDLIVSWNDTRVNGREMENAALGLLLEAVANTQSMVESDPGRITVDPEHPQWPRHILSDGDTGHAFFMCGPGDPEGFLYRGTLNPDGTRAGDQMQLIEKLKGTGANCIYLMAVRSMAATGIATHNPFIDHDPAKAVNPRRAGPVGRVVHGDGPATALSSISSSTTTVPGSGTRATSRRAGTRIHPDVGESFRAPRAPDLVHRGGVRGATHRRAGPANRRD